MNLRHPTHTSGRRSGPTTSVVIVVVGAALVALVACSSLDPSSPPGKLLSVTLDSPSVDGDAADEVDATTVFDDDVPAVDRLDPALLRTLRAAAADAADDGVTFDVTSGWRSTEHQERLLREAVSTYGSEVEAARWVATPETSPHVSGDAVDVGGYDAIAWLSEHGRAYGLCQIYDNEPWHYELRPEAISQGCPRMYFDPTYDPRMQD